MPRRSRRFVWMLVVAVFAWASLLCAAENEEAVPPKKELVAVLHVTTTGLNGESKDYAVENDMIAAINTAGHRGVSMAETDKFLKSAEGADYTQCVSVECTARAGAKMGVRYVVSGSIIRVNGNTKINLTLIHTREKRKVADDRQSLEKGQPLAAALESGMARLLKQMRPKPKPIVVPDIPRPGYETAEQRKAKEERFYKGNLTTIGPLEIIPRDNRVGVVTGYRRLAFTHYVHVEPQVDLRFFPDDVTKESNLRLGFGIPLNLEIFAGEDRNNDENIDKWDNAGIPRKEDWDSWRDYFQLIRYIQYGRKEDNLYVNINRTYSASVGHGLVMKRYIPNLDYFTTRVSAEVDAYSRYGGGELYIGDITRYNLIGGLLFLKPGSFFSDNWMAESLSFGVHYTTDWDAPESVLANRANDDGSYIYDSAAAHFVGADVELKVVKWPVNRPEVDVKTYFDFTNWVGNGSGFALGALGRFNLYTEIRQAFRARVEFRGYQDNYTPSYFDPFYEIMKYKWFSQSRPATSKTATATDIKTKYTEFSNRPGDWKHFGAYLEFSYALLDYVGLTIAFDEASGSDNGNFLFHVEVPATKYFQIAATYYKVNVNSAKNVFDPTSDNTMLIALARLRPIQLLAFQFGIRKTLQPSVYRYFPNLESVWDLKADLDISWEF